MKGDQNVEIKPKIDPLQRINLYNDYLQSEGTGDLYVVIMIYRNSKNVSREWIFWSTTSEMMKFPGDLWNWAMMEFIGGMTATIVNWKLLGKQSPICIMEKSLPTFSKNVNISKAIQYFLWAKRKDPSILSVKARDKLVSGLAPLLTSWTSSGRNNKRKIL